MDKKEQRRALTVGSMLNVLETAMTDVAARTENDAILRDEIADYLDAIFSAEDSGLASLDLWTRRRVLEENMAKIALVYEAADPVEYCYQNLIREIDSEAEMGIYLIGTRHAPRDLQALGSDPGISGKLHREMDCLAPVVFPDELAHSRHDMDIVWVTIRARFDRARIDATVSEMIMAHLQGDSSGVNDMTNAMRSLLYSFHEDLARRLTGLPLMLNERSTRELVTMISELAQRAGDYDGRVAAITGRAANA